MDCRFIVFIIAMTGILVFDIVMAIHEYKKYKIKKIQQKAECKQDKEDQ